MKKKNLLVVLVNILFIGLFAKGLSIVSKIIMTRSFGLEAISIFSMINPMLVLVLTLSNLSLPTVIATLISKNRKKCTSIIISSFSLCIVLCLSLMIIVNIFTPFISSSLLHSEKVIPCLRAFILLIPLTSISSIIKGYFLGIGEIKLTSVAQVFEESGRLLFILIAIYLFTNQNDEFKASLCVYSLCLGEVFQMGAHIIFSSNKIYKKVRYVLQEFTKKENYHLQEIISFSLPLTTARLVGSLTYFFEPIILSTVMLSKGFSSSFITNMYGVYNTYVLGLLLVPTYLQMAISTSLLPEISKNYQNLDKVKRIFNKTLIFSLILGICANAFLYLFCDEILWIVFRTHEGVTYVRFMAFFFSVFYMEAPINSTLQALGKNAFLMRTTLYGTIIRLLCLFVFAYLRLGMFALILAEIINVFVCVLINYTKLMYTLKKRPC